ncbi:DUF1501 domain-containing protein [Paludibaculum fermentans]|uniref:DUF1501 domain-containing protein n=1 Tax=Paludibaculum fermentans TaxID=1473598 RepID=A0A7S7NXP7_PALFE|nr:DUF1501 domain-containing protein [Paludibaculum fermentans]QOY91677.1 DUF1501 domain-containing protein [Paludibaculum fermentans]
MNRRTFLWNHGGGLGGVALAHMLARNAAASGKGRPELNGGLHHKARAKRVIQLFMSGAASQCDTFDYKPLLIQKGGQAWDPGEKVELFQSNPGVVMPSPWGWKQYGQCGKWVSDLLPHTAGCVDDIAFVASMMAKSNVHGPATFMQNTGFILPGFPSAGAWVSYALGSEAENLPDFVVLPDPRGMPPNGAANWSSGFLPASNQATTIRVGTPTPIHDLRPPKEAGFITDESERQGLALLDQVNKMHAAERAGDLRLDARIASYEMAARLQLSAPTVLDISGESKATRDAYGLDEAITADMGQRCLVARRLVERGVRFVQVWSGADNGFPRRNWDSHENLAKDHGELGRALDKPVAGLLKDLKARGLLEDTIVYWTTEFGRMPCSQGSKGRDHNPFGFTSWFAGGGFKGGTTYGATDEWSYKAVDKPVYCYDVHATLLHAMGIDHTKLTFRHNGIDRRLTDVHGVVIPEMLS